MFLLRPLPRAKRCAGLPLLIAGLLFPASTAAQEKPLGRTFLAGTVNRYRIQLTVHSELEGQQTRKIGAKTYVTPFQRFAEASFSWRATRRIVSAGDDGAAEVEESLDEMSKVEGRCSPEDSEEVQRLLAALRGTLEKWGAARTLRYRETPAGQLQGLSALGVPILDEAAPQLLTPWLLRSLRPAAALPAQPLQFSRRWEEPRAVQLPNWTGAQGTESGEWIEVPGTAEPAARLHVVQQISGTVAAGADRPAEGTAEGRFHGESLAVVSLADGRLLSATRSGLREITWVLGAIEGLPEPPRFRGRLSVQIRIEEIE